MSGIAGYVGVAAGVVDESVLRRMARQLEHRGPDAEGVVVHGRVGLVHRRLAVIDRAGGGQPLRSTDGRYLLVYDGEVYNYRDLREELIAIGHTFATRGDAEVVMAAWTHWGRAAFDRFNGGFALAILDTTTGELTLVRDPFGAAPLYLAADGSGRVAFASEIRALLAAGVVPRRPDDRTIHRYLCGQRHDDTERTFFDRITRLLPGQLAVVSPAGQVHRETYTRLFHELDQLAAARRPHASAARAQLTAETEAAIRRRLVSDVPVGVALTGELASSAAVAGCAYRLDLHKVRPGPASFVDDLPDFVRTQQEPVGSPGAYPDYWVMREARQHVTVLLAGGTWVAELAADRAPLPLALPLAIGNRLRRRRRASRLLAGDFVAAYPIAPDPADLTGEARPGPAEELFRRRLAALLRYEDRNSQRFSIQRRTPQLDPCLLRLQWSLDRWGAAGRPALPMIDPRAAGNLGREVFSSASFGARPYADRAAVAAAYQDYLDGRAYADPLLFWRLLNLELWLQEFVDRDPTAPPASTFLHHYPVPAAVPVSPAPAPAEQPVTIASDPTATGEQDKLVGADSGP